MFPTFPSCRRQKGTGPRERDCGQGPEPRRRAGTLGDRRRGGREPGGVRGLWAELWVEAIRNAELQELNERFYGEWRDIVASIFRDGQRSGDIHAPGDPVELANMMVSMLDGLALQVLAGSKAMTVDAMRTTCLRFVDQLSTASVG
jgi:hypothetical protein